MSISNEAVKAARLAVERAMRQRTYDRHAHDDEVFQEGVAHIAIAALTAAAPIIQAAALRDAADAADDPSPDEMDFYKIDQAEIGNWLRARADQLEGKM